MIYLSEREYQQWLAAIMGPMPPDAVSWKLLEACLPYDLWQVYVHCEPELPTEADFARAELLRRLELN